MSEDPTQGTEGTPQAEYQAPASQADLDRIIEARLSRERAKFQDYESLKEDSAKLKELEEANKTALEKAEERAKSAEEKAAMLEHEKELQTWAGEVSQETGIPASVIKGTTREEMSAHANQIKQAIPMHANGGEGGEVPPPSLSKEEILAIKDDKERKAAIAENIDLFT